MATLTEQNFEKIFTDSVTEVGLLFVDYEAEMNEILSEALFNDISKKKINGYMELAVISALAVDKDISKYIRDRIADSYKFGFEFSNEILGKSKYNDDNKAQVSALADEAIIDFRAGIQGVTAKTERVMLDTLVQQIKAKLGRAPKALIDYRDISEDVLKQFGKNGVTGFITKNGKNMPLKWYAETLTRTHITKAANDAIISNAIKSGKTRVKVSSHPGACHICIPYQGKVYDVLGRDGLDTPPPMPIHPNCKHLLIPLG